MKVVKQDMDLHRKGVILIINMEHVQNVKLDLIHLEVRILVHYVQQVNILLQEHLNVLSVQMENMQIKLEVPHVKHVQISVMEIV